MDDSPLTPRQRDVGYKQALAGILDIGEALLTNGAEVMRVEDTISRLCCAYGFARTDVFTITSSIVITAVSREGGTYTQTRRIRSRGTDLDKVARANDLSRRLCACPVPPEKLRDEVCQLHHGPVYPPKLMFFVYGIISAIFSIFFGGTFPDACAAFISGLVLYAALWAGGSLRMNGILLNTVCSAVTALAVTLLWKAGLGDSPDKIIIGNIMLLIPGLALTSSLRDMINGDTISGLLGFCEAIIKAGAIAIGSAFVLRGLGV